MFESRNISKVYAVQGHEVSVLQGASMSLEPGESAVIMGPSGSGKSTFLNIIGSLESPTDGHVLIDGVDPFSLNESDLARFRNTTIGFVFQEHHLLPQCTVMENVLLPTLAFRTPSKHGNTTKHGNTSNTDERGRMLIEKVGLSHRINHRPSELSGGERQRVAIARALINQPAVVLADEPTGNLDHQTAERIGELLISLPRDEHIILIAVTHSDALAQRFQHRYDLIDGALHERTMV